MAIIKCQECGKDVSDKATLCVHCGCPIQTDTPIVHKKTFNTNAKSIIVASIFVLLASLCMTIFIVIPNVKNEQKYKRVLSLLELGLNEEAKVVMEEIADYKDIEKIKEQIIFEDSALYCAQTLLEELNTSQSIRINEFHFYEPQESLEPNTNWQVCLMSFDIINSSEAPISEYAYFFRKPNQQYEYKGMCKSLDMDDYKDRLNDNKEIFEEGMVCSSIMLYRKQCVEVGSVNIDRVKRLFARSIDTIIIP